MIAVLPAPATTFAHLDATTVLSRQISEDVGLFGGTLEFSGVAYRGSLIKLVNSDVPSIALSAGLTRVADATPGLGIVAAVLGVIHTMGAITEPPEVLRCGIVFLSQLHADGSRRSYAHTGSESGGEVHEGEGDGET